METNKELQTEGDSKLMRNLKKIIIYLLMIYGTSFIIGALGISYFIILSIFENGFIRFIEPNKIMLFIELISILISFTSFPFIVYYSFKNIRV